MSPHRSMRLNADLAFGYVSRCATFALCLSLILVAIAPTQIYAAPILSGMSGVTCSWDGSAQADADAGHPAGNVQNGTSCNPGINWSYQDSYGIDQYGRYGQASVGFSWVGASGIINNNLLIQGRAAASGSASANGWTASAYGQARSYSATFTVDNSFGYNIQGSGQLSNADFWLRCLSCVNDVVRFQGDQSYSGMLSPNTYQLLVQSAGGGCGASDITAISSCSFNDQLAYGLQLSPGGVPGSTASNPLLPITVSSPVTVPNPGVVSNPSNLPTYSFFGVGTPAEGNPAWYDPPSAYGFDYSVTGSTFTDITTPSGPGFPSGPVDLYIGDVLTAILNPGDTYNFLPGISDFSLRGINPLLDVSDPNFSSAYPVQLGFSSNASLLSMTALSAPNSAVPEPGTLFLFGTGVTGLLVLRRRHRPAIGAFT